MVQLSSLNSKAAFLVAGFMVVMTTCILKTEAIEVDTLSGRVRGFTQDVDGVNVDTYLGIPFAEPPVGSLRFRSPHPIPNWTGVKEAVDLPKTCMQTPDISFNRFSGVKMWNPNTNISEDCLYLNIWVPRVSSGPRLVTIVWIYGGAFVTGSSTLDIYNGKYLAAKKLVIVASMQYRLGVHGFLYSGTNEAPGNMGLLDQQLAMKWINENIEAFNGDKTKITLLGESAGSASVNHHLLASSSWPFFNNAIMLSSSSLADYSYESSKYLLNKFYSFAKVMGCDDDDKETILQCLRNADVNNVEAKQWELENKRDISFNPVIDGSFLKDTPENLIDRDNVKSADVVLGNTRDEGEYFLHYTYRDIFKPDNLWNPTPLSRGDYMDVVKRTGSFRDGVELESVLYTYEYSVLASRRPTYRDLLDDIIGDYLFKCPVHDFANRFSSLRPKKGRTYMYSFEYRHSVNPWPSWMGVLHGYEIEMVFGLPFDSERNYSAKDRIVSEHIMEYFTSFAKTGSPNSQKTPTIWPEYTPDREQHLVFTQEASVATREDYRHKECSFWNSLFPKIRRSEDRRGANSSSGIVASGILTMISVVYAIAKQIL